MSPRPSANPTSVGPVWRLAPGLMRWGLVIACLLLVGLLTYRFSESQGIAQLQEQASQQLDIQATAIDGEVTRHASIPGAIQLNAEVLTLLRAEPAQRGKLRAPANRFLRQLNDHLGGPAVFVLDTTGEVVASSDWIYSDNLLGSNLSYMPFFASAVHGAPMRHYAIDHVRNEPGYYFALPIRDERRDWVVIGVAVVKSGVWEVERRWQGQQSPALIVDNNGIVLIASPPEWRYAALQPMSGETLVDLVGDQFAGREVGRLSLDLALEGADNGVVVQLPRHLLQGDLARAANKSYLVLSRNLPETAWRMVVFSDLHPVATQAATHAALVMAALGCLLLGGHALRQRRHLAATQAEAQRLLARSHQELERKVEERTLDLSEAVGRLQREVAERQRAEQTLRAAQDDLVQAAKLAVVGQMAAGITHELSQPLGAMRTLAENAIEFIRRGDAATATHNLNIVGQLAEQAGRIIQPLKSFARKSPATPAAVDLAFALDAALFLFDQRLKKRAVTVVHSLVAGQWIAWCDQNRLQQVLVNLIANALDALAGQPQPQLMFAVSRQGQHLALRVRDNGCGLSEVAQAHLFEPFFTTKPPGEGLGLGLTISRDILREFGGDLRLETPAEGGACFVILLPEPVVDTP